MSWMDSWSRPSKSQATPPPLYLTNDDVKYCVACGRVIGARRTHKQNEIVKYCSDGCRKRRLGPLDKRLDKTILSLLKGEGGSGLDQINVKDRFRKGDSRIVIFCDEIEKLFFQSREPEEVQARIEEEEEESDDPYKEVDLDSLDQTTLQGRKPNPEGPGSKEKQQKGQRKAEEREMVRRAARRAVVFGFPADTAYTDAELSLKAAQANAPETSESGLRRKCEALMHGQVVEPSFAKGDWAIRWRD